MSEKKVKKEEERDGREVTETDRGLRLNKTGGCEARTEEQECEGEEPKYPCVRYRTERRSEIEKEETEAMNEARS